MQNTKENQQTSYHGMKSVYNRGMLIKSETKENLKKSLSELGFNEIMSITNSNIPDGKFGILFEDLPAYDPSNEGIERVAELMREKEDSDADSSNIPLGIAFLGQFIDHDLTLEPVSRFDDRLDQMALVNFRTPSLDLDSIYGSSPDVARHLYDTYGYKPDGTKNDVPGGEHRLPFRLLTQDENVSIDVQRNHQGTAVIGDPRNDENLFISQLHRMIVGFHNEVIIALLKEQGGNPQANKDLYEEARKLVTLHYHWIVINEFLPFIIGSDLTKDILINGRKFYKYEENSTRPFIPIEFAGAAYRFGHTLIRSTYNINDSKKNIDLFKAPFFGVLIEGQVPVMQKILKKEFNLDWKYFLDFGNNHEKMQFCRKIDSKISEKLFDLPFIDAQQDSPVSLPERNMKRARTLSLPSGQQIAKKMKIEIPNIKVYTNEELGLNGIDGLHNESPLWFYILKEAEIENRNRPDGQNHLGAVGGRIVGETLIGIIEGTRKTLFPKVNYNNWKPKFGTDGVFTLKDLISFKG